MRGCGGERSVSCVRETAVSCVREKAVSCGCERARSCAREGPIVRIATPTQISTRVLTGMCECRGGGGRMRACVRVGKASACASARAFALAHGVCASGSARTCVPALGGLQGADRSCWVRPTCMYWAQQTCTRSHWMPPTCTYWVRSTWLAAYDLPALGRTSNRSGGRG